jgi:hypothetical protein
MLKRMILSGLLAVAALPVLASDAGFDVKALSATTSASATPAQKAESDAKAQIPAKHDCSCQQHHHA